MSRGRLTAPRRTAPPIAGRPRAVLAAAVLSGGVLLAPLAGAAAQPVVGGFDDATLPGRWEARLRVAAAFEGTSEQFGGLTGTGGRAPLGARFAFDSLGASRLPVVARTQRFLRDSVGVGVGLTLGTVSTGARTLVTRVPLQLDLGITRRLAVGVMVPLVRTRAAVNVRVNEGGTTGNLGFNPANATASGTANAAAATRNAQVQAQLRTVADSLQALVTNCPASTTGAPAACVPVIANRAGATQLVAQTRTVAGGIARVYGNGTPANPGALLVPIQGTDAQRAVEARLQALGTQFAAFQVPGLGTPTAPAGATARIASAGLQRVLTEQAFGVLADSLEGVQRAGVGDVEVGASFMWLDTFGASAARMMPGLRVRSTVGAGYRLRTGSADLAFDAFDVPTGSGAGALLLRTATDVAFSRRIWASVIARVESPIARQQLARIPVFAGELLATADRERLVDRRLGRQVHVEVTPRWAPNEAFAIAAHYALRSKQADRYSGTFTSTDTTAGTPLGAFDAAILGEGTAARAQIAGFGITYSTLPAVGRGRSWLPIEVSYLHTTTVAGSGGIVPRTRVDQLTLRIYAQILGRSDRRAR